MKTLNLRPLQIIGLVLACQMLLLLSGSGLLAQAQEPAPFQISIIPAADHAVSGQPFTYTVVITNVSDAAVQYASINVDVPEGTKFIRTYYTDEKWYGGNSYADPEQEVKQVQMITPETVESGEVFTFEMIVEVLAAPEESITVADYDADLIRDRVAPAVGPPIELDVREPTPTLTPTILPSPTALPTVTPEVTIEARAGTAQANVIVPAETPSTDNTITSNSASSEIVDEQPLWNTLSIGISISVLTVLVLVFVGVIWFLRRR